MQEWLKKSVVATIGNSLVFGRSELVVTFAVGAALSVINSKSADGNTHNHNHRLLLPSKGERMKFDCEHDNGWIGSPPGFLPVSWKCIDCGASMTSGEMIIWVKLAKQIRDIKNGLDALDSQCSHVQIDESSP